ncbi:MAG: hypothetical protein JWO76_812, partial [Nocardioides sp.]|nr:hypothetical protein [Nocardioides sp.]
AERYTPTGGVSFNSPLGDSATRNRIFNKITKSIYAAPKGSTIRIFTWNFLTRAGVEALLKAQDRGVRVKLLMSETNTTQIENQPFKRLHRELKAGNKHRKAKRHSYARVCSKSCRGNYGTAHAKFYLFSKSGKARQVLMQGSANYTVASGSNQWNDMVTSVGREKLYNYAKDVFEQAAKDEPVHPPFISRDFGSTRLMFFPEMGKKSTDPVMDLLNQVRCRNAENTPNGRTVLRLAPDVIREERGMTIGRKLRSLWEHGCDIHIGYTVMGVAVGRMLRNHSGRGPVPLKHLVQDVDNDGEFDNYFHLKAMSIVGHLGKNRSAYALLNGSANMSGNSKVSDENVAIYRRKQITMKYQAHINYWYDNFPQPKSSPSGRSRLMFGDGPNYVLEGESPAQRRSARTGVNPFAHVDMD